MVNARPQSFVVDAESLSSALVRFVTEDRGRLLGTITETEHRAVATAWKNGVYLVCAEPAPD
jgi:hypothetical protein